jgi:hypothetical protein
LEKNHKKIKYVSAMESNGIVVLKTNFLNNYGQNCGSEEKVNLDIFLFFVQKMHNLVGGQPNHMSFT